MLLCKGHGCQYRKVCSRYVLGRGMTQYPGCGDRWIDHCTNAKRFVRCGSDDNENADNGK